MNELQTLISACKAKVNAMLGGLPPLEQFEKAPELAYGFRCLQNSANDLMAQMGAVGDKAQALFDTYRGTVSAEVKAEMAKEGYVSKADHEAAVTAAVNTTTTQLRQEIADTAAIVTLVAQRRQGIIDAKTLTAVTASKLPDSVLQGDGFTANVAKVVERIKKAEKFGITASTAPEVVEQIAELPLDEAGEKLFRDRMTLIEKTTAAITAGRRVVTGGAIVLNPLAGAGAAAAVSDDDTDIVSRLC